MTLKQDIPKLAYSIKEACQAIGICRTTFQKHIADGHIRVVHVGGRVLIPAQVLHDLVADGL